VDTDELLGRDVRGIEAQVNLEYISSARSQLGGDLQTFPEKLPVL
jgi:hypothetical protein